MKPLDPPKGERRKEKGKKEMKKDAIQMLLEGYKASIISVWRVTGFVW